MIFLVLAYGEKVRSQPIEDSLELISLSTYDKSQE